MGRMKEIDVLVQEAVDAVLKGNTFNEATGAIIKVNNLTQAEAELLGTAVDSRLFDIETEQYDAMLERQEIDDFCQDGDFENMDALGDFMNYNTYEEWKKDAERMGLTVENSGDGKMITHDDGDERGWFDPKYGGFGMGILYCREYN